MPSGAQVPVQRRRNHHNAARPQRSPLAQAPKRMGTLRADTAVAGLKSVRSHPAGSVGKR